MTPLWAKLIDGFIVLLLIPVGILSIPLVIAWLLWEMRQERLGRKSSDWFHRGVKI